MLYKTRVCGEPERVSHRRKLAKIQLSTTFPGLAHPPELWEQFAAVVPELERSERIRTYMLNAEAEAGTDMSNLLYFLRCRWVWTLPVLAGSLALALAILQVNRHDCVTRASYNRIKKGMTLCEVGGILGGPPGDYTAWPHPINDQECLRSPGGTGEEWLGEEGLIQVAFDRNGKVEGTYFERGADHTQRLIWEWRRLAGPIRALLAHEPRSSF